MPLITSDIFQARSAYAVLELRAQNAEHAVATLQSTVDTLTGTQSQILDHVSVEHEFTVGEIAVNAQQNAQQAGQVSPDLSLQSFIAALGLSIALAEATMPDRTIGPVSASVQSFLTFNIGPDGVTHEPGLRLYQPELGAPTALATTSFDLVKTPPAAGVGAPRSLYSVLMDKQALFSSSFWAGLTSGNPPSAAAPQLVGEVGKIFAAIGSWSFQYLLGEAATIASLETLIATALQSASPGNATSGYAAAVGRLSAAITAFQARSVYVAGDLYALTSALDATTASARAVHA